MSERSQARVFKNAARRAAEDTRAAGWTTARRKGARDLGADVRSNAGIIKAAHGGLVLVGISNPFTYTNHEKVESGVYEATFFR